MKCKSLIAIGIFSLSMLSETAYANVEKLDILGQQPQEINRSQTAAHEKIGSAAITQNGFSMDNEKIIKEVTKRGGRYYVIIAEQGEQNHKTIEIEIYK